MEPTDRIEFKWPWKTLPVECIDEWIGKIRPRIGPGHPLHKKVFFPAARRETDDAILVEREDDGTYVLVSLERTAVINHRRMPFTKVIGSKAELAQQIEQEHQEAVTRAYRRGQES